MAISSTGLVDPRSQEIGMTSPLYEGFGKRLVRHLRSTYQCPVAAENDGNCALLAEKWLGHAQNCASFATIVLGTS
ncbi:ROK family protein, partial [Lactococcus lactis]|uniref:ROK family protein n=1 Tax=Lactococcus lactis TaxID=1358 RepID=UPI003D0DD03D